MLALIGIGLMMYYDYCDTTCSYLKGDIWGIDLKWLGSAYMAAIIVFVTFKQTPFVRALLAQASAWKSIYMPFRCKTMFIARFVWRFP